MTPQQMQEGAALLERLEAEHRSTTGYGNATIRGIAISLRHECLEAAQAEWHNDGDKVAVWPTLKDALVTLLGCRLHHTHNCQSWICTGVLPRDQGGRG